MKLWLILVLIFFGVGIWLLGVIQGDGGYVLISLYGKTLETSFWFAATTLFVLLLLGYLFWGLIRKIFRTILRGGAWFSGQRSLAIERQYREGLLNFLTGDFKTANKQLSAVSRRNELPVVRVIASAQAMAVEGEFDEALGTLKSAEEKYPQDLPWLMKARVPLLVKAGKIRDAEFVLSQLKLIAANDAALPRLEHLILREGENWQDASLFVSDKKLAKTLTHEDVEQTHAHALEQLLHDPNLSEDKLASLWSNIPKQLKSRPPILLPYAQLLFMTKQHALLEEVIVFAFETQWISELIDLYAKLESKDVTAQLNRAERWLKRNPEDTHLLLCLGVLSIKSQLWGKARDYFEQANALRENPRALYFLGYISEKLNEPNRSNTYYKRAAELAHL